MLGKASEIKIQMEYSDHWVNQWLGNNPNANVIDIRMALVPQSPLHQNEQAFLIIYKEDKPNARSK